MKCYVAHKIDDDTVYYKCDCGETHAKDNDFDFLSNRLIFRTNECDGKEIGIDIKQSTKRVLPQYLMNIYKNQEKVDVTNLQKMMREKKQKYMRRYLGTLGNL